MRIIFPSVFVVFNFILSKMSGCFEKTNATGENKINSNSTCKIGKFSRLLDTVETQFNEVPRDWANWIVILRVCYMENLVIMNLLENNQSVHYIGV